jgi:hypothetical protein
MMGFGDIHGSAKVDPRNPRAFARCDFGGEWRNLHELHKQMEWLGTKLSWTGFLVCSEHLDRPQEQLRPIRLPPDPVPVLNPRFENFQAINRPIGLTTYVMWAGGQPLNFAVVLEDGNGNPILTDTGQPILLEVGSDADALLAQLQQMSGIPVPGNINNYSGTIAAQNVSQQAVAPNPARSYVAIFNPCTVPLGVNFGPATVGVPPSQTIGPGNCLFWATAQGLSQPNTGAIQVSGAWTGTPYYLFEA